MVINNNEHDFKGKTLQEYLEWKYPERVDKESVKEINAIFIKRSRKEVGITGELEGGELDLREFKNVKEVDIWRYHLGSPLTKLNVSNLTSLERLYCFCNNLTSINFLNQLLNPERLEHLSIYNNNIKPTDIEIFSRFVNLEILRIGTMRGGLERGERNRFYGSLKSYQNLTKLESICIEATDVDSGLEYLPESLVLSIKERIQKNEEKGGYHDIRCSPHDTDAGCKAIQNELRPFNYDLEAWQLAHPDKMLKVWKEKYQDKENLIKKDLETKSTETQVELTTTKTNELREIKINEYSESKIKSLERELYSLRLAQENKELKEENKALKEEIQRMKSTLGKKTTPIHSSECKRPVITPQSFYPRVGKTDEELIEMSQAMNMNSNNLPSPSLFDFVSRTQWSQNEPPIIRIHPEIERVHQEMRMERASRSARIGIKAINMVPYTEKMESPTPIEIPVIQQVHEQNYVSETQNLNLRGLNPRDQGYPANVEVPPKR